MKGIVDSLGGATGDGQTRQLAFAINGLSLDTGDEPMRLMIDNAFAVGEQNNVAVVLHVHDSMESIVEGDRSERRVRCTPASVIVREARASGENVRAASSNSTDGSCCCCATSCRVAVGRS